MRTTVRNLKREGDVRAMLKEGGAEPGECLSFVVADLEKDAGWSNAVAGCEYVLHMASPLPPNVPKSEDELIIPAREGTLRVLRASRDAGVKRVVLTSSFAAIGYGHKERKEPFNETDWTDPNGDDVMAYVKSKTLAERAAWDFIAQEGGNLELSAINPVGVFGPVLGPDYSTSILLVQRLDGRRHTRLPTALFRCCRCSRRRRFAHPRNDSSRRERRTFPRGRRRFHIDAGDSQVAEGSHGCGGQKSPDSSTA